MDEFGMGSHSMNSAYGAVTNGRGFKALSVGGSSGGSALAVAAKLAHVGIGTDTGGSIRLPAAYMSVLGFKPSYGMISRKGVIPYANSLDTVGIIARSAEDIRLTFDILRTPDENDPTCLTSSSWTRVQEAKNRRRVAVLGSQYVVVGTDQVKEAETGPHRHSDWKNLRSQLVAQREFTRRIGVPLEYNIAEMHPLVRWAWTATLSYLESVGCEIVPISLPSTRHALSSYYVLAPAEASSNLAKYDGVRYGAVRQSPSDDVGGTLYSKHRSDNLGPEVKRRILLGTYSLSAGAMDNYFIQAQKIRRMVQQDFDDVFRMPNPLKQDTEVKIHGVDFIIVPTAPSPPPRLRYLQRSTPVENYMNDVFTVPASLAGLPSMSVPAPRHPDHPWRPEVAVGMQIIGQYGDDYSVMYLAQNFMTNFHPLTNMKRVQSHKILKQSTNTSYMSDSLD
ncbi:amidase [Exophiala viscosa]|uniref:Amidase n=2 Tax=Exophiala viscosa TaxID=2486360 RepID=A0AAN6E661_9EURO|nr:amidase [Exophiala viscosa]